LSEFHAGVKLKELMSKRRLYSGKSFYPHPPGDVTNLNVSLFLSYNFLLEKFIKDFL
jgi:hypothetical protein